MNTINFTDGLEDTLQAFLSVTCGVIMRYEEYGLDESSLYVPMSMGRRLVALLALMRPENKFGAKQDKVYEFEIETNHALLHELLSPNYNGMGYDDALKNWEDVNSDDDGYDWSEHNSTIDCFMLTVLADMIAGVHCSESLSVVLSDFDDSYYVSYKWVEPLIGKYKELMEIMTEDQRQYALIVYSLLMSSAQYESMLFDGNISNFKHCTWKAAYEIAKQDILRVHNEFPVLIGKDFYAMWRELAEHTSLEGIPTTAMIVS